MDRGNMMKKLTEIRWHGRGGQGAKTASLLLADVAFSTGLYIQGFPEYGPERMGAPITAYNRLSNEGTGFSFANINAHEMTGVLAAAVDLYHSDKQAWKALQHNAMTADFSWTRSAAAYCEIYSWVTGK